MVAWITELIRGSRHTVLCYFYWFLWASISTGLPRKNWKRTYKLLESKTLVQQAASNTKQQFANSPDLSHELMNAIMDALSAHSTMSKQALESEKVRGGLKDILLGPGQLYEALREKTYNHVQPEI